MYTPIRKNHVNDCHGNHEFFFHSANKFIFEDKYFFSIFGIPVNELAPMKNCVGVQGRSH